MPPEVGSREWYQMIGRRGGKARAAMPGFQEHQRHAGRRSAEVNDMSELGKKGAAATAEKYGWDLVRQKAREWRLNNPSCHEQDVIKVLDEMGLDYEREAEIEGKFVDFYLPKQNTVIEVYGRVHEVFRDDDQKRQEIERLEQIRAAGYRVEKIDYTELTRKRIKEIFY